MWKPSVTQLFTCLLWKRKPCCTKSQNSCSPPPQDRKRTCYANKHQIKKKKLRTYLDDEPGCITSATTQEEQSPTQPVVHLMSCLFPYLMVHYDQVRRPHMQSFPFVQAHNHCSSYWQENAHDLHIPPSAAQSQLLYPLDAQNKLVRTCICMRTCTFVAVAIKSTYPTTTAKKKVTIGIRFKKFEQKPAVVSRRP